MIDIVIVNWNSGDYLLRCLESILSTSNLKIIGQVFIIDNNSSDNSLSFLSPHPKIVVVQNKENFGFSKACNQGFKLCSSAFVLLLNPDVQLLKTTLVDCTDFMQKKNDIAILGCQLLDDEGKITYSCSRFPSLKGIFFDSTGLSRIAPAIFKPGVIMTDWDHKSSRYVDQVMGAFMFMRMSIFSKIGFFDEQFFVYYEEVDFSKRVSHLGGKSFFNADIKAIHSGQGTTNSVKGFRLFLNLQSKLQYAKKHFSFYAYLLVYFCTFFIEPITRFFFLILSGRIREVKDLWEGYKLLIGVGSKLNPGIK